MKIALCWLALVAANSAFVASRLRCDGSNLAHNDLSTSFSIDNQNPRFTWASTHYKRGEQQIAVQVIVKEANPQTDFESQPILWDSGIISTSESSLQYSSEAPTLKSDTKYMWIVRMTDSQNRLSETPSPGVFHMALIGEIEWDGVSWVAETGMNIMRSQFTVADPADVKSCTIYVCGLSYSMVRFNGNAAAPNLLTTSPWTNNARRNEYSSLDVTSTLLKVTRTHGLLC